MPTLVLKFIRDVRVSLAVVAALLLGFQCLWAKVTQRITMEIIPSLTQKNITPDFIIKTLFKGPGQLIQTLIGGENINFLQPWDVLSIGYVHPLTITILCVWAVGRAAGAIAGEIDRGTIELLLAQPVARQRVVLAHLLTDLCLIPVLCLSIWAGNWLGMKIFGEIDFDVHQPVLELRGSPIGLLPGLVNVAALLFAVSGCTMWISAAGRFRGRVLGLAVLATLLQFLVNVIGQLWSAVAPLRPFTVFYYYQPQQLILKGHWSVDLGETWNLGHPVPINIVAVLLAVGVLGYLMAVWIFSRRDIPAPL